MPTIMYRMSSSAGQLYADLALALTLVLLGFVLWPLLPNIDKTKTSQRTKLWLKIAVAIFCFALSLFVLYPKYLQAFA